MINEQSNLVPLFSTLAGAIVSLISSWGAVWWTKQAEQKLAAHQLANAFKGEISALIHIAELRNYAGGLKALAQWSRINNSAGFFSAPSREEYCTIYKANASKLGSLKGKLPEQIAIFYTLLTSLQEDMKTLDEIHLGTRSDLWLGQPAKAAQRYDDIATLIEDTITKAKVTVAQIDQLYPT